MLSNLLLSPVVALSATSGKSVTKISSFKGSPWGLTENFDLFNVQTNVTYIRSPETPLAEGSYIDVPGLNPGVDNPLSIPYLIALTYFPLSLPLAVLIDSSNGIMVKLLGGDYKGRPAQHFWQFPDDGIPDTAHPGYRFVPGACDYSVNAIGEIHRISTDSEVVPGSGREGKVLIDADNGTSIEISVARLVLLAHGKYDHENWLDDITFIDGDSTNISLVNMTLSVVEVTGKFIETPFDKVRTI